MGFSKEFFCKVFLRRSFFFQNIFISCFFKEFFQRGFFFQWFYKEYLFTRCSFFFQGVFPKEIKQSWAIRETVKKSDRKCDDDANRETQKLKNRAKRARIAEMKDKIEYIRIDLHETIDEM